MVPDTKQIPLKSFEEKKSPQYWRWFLPPMLLLSVGLHGLVLFTPMAPDEDELVPPPDPEEDGIAITKIDPPKKPRPVAAAPAAPQPAAPAAQGRPAQSTGTAAGSGSSASTTSRGTSSNTTQSRGQAQSRGSRGGGRQNQSNAGVSVPPLPAGQQVQNPNPNAPNVGTDNRGTTSGTDDGTAIARANLNAFKEYFEIFGTYLGVKSLSESELETLRGNWLSSFSERSPAYSGVELTPLEGLDKLPYEANICLPSPPAPAQMMVMVEPDGTINDDRQFLQTTGYHRFDEDAREAILAHDFPDEATPKAYLVEVEVEYDAENCDWPPKVEQLPANYLAVLKGYVGPDLTTPNSAKEAQEAWLESLTELEGVNLPRTDDGIEPILLEDFEPRVEYPPAICLPLDPKPSQWGVVVNGDGKIEGEPTMLRSTGYGSFNDRAEELLAEHTFPPADTEQAYVVTIKVDYNRTNCTKPDDPALRIIAQNSPTASPPETTAETSTDAPSATPMAIAFNPELQPQWIEAGRQAVLADPVGGLNHDPGLLSAVLETVWPEGIASSCFVSALDTEKGPQPVEVARDAIALSESFDPLTLSRLYSMQVLPADTYCDAPLYEMRVDGVSQLFVSAIGFGTGNANTLLIIWPTDPRQD